MVQKTRVTDSSLLVFSGEKLMSEEEGQETKKGEFYRNRQKLYSCMLSTCTSNLNCTTFLETITVHFIFF